MATISEKRGQELYNVVAVVDRDERCRARALEEYPGDYSRIILTTLGKPVVDVEINSNDAYAENVIKILDSKGTYTPDFTGYELTCIVDGVPSWLATAAFPTMPNI